MLLMFAHAVWAAEKEAHPDFFTWGRIAKALYFIAGLAILADILNTKKIRSFGSRSSDVTLGAGGLAIYLAWLLSKSIWYAVGWCIFLVFLTLIVSLVFPTLGAYIANASDWIFSWFFRIAVVLAAVLVIFGVPVLVIGAFIKIVLTPEDVSRSIKIASLVIFVVGFVIDFTVG